MRTQRKIAAGLAVASAIALAGCRGSDSSGGSTDGTSAATEAPASSDSATDDSMADDSMADDSMADDSMADDSMADDSMADDSMAEGHEMDDSTDMVDAGSVECPGESPGLTADSIKLGNTSPLSGPAAAYSSIPKGITAWFNHLNDTDGGFKLKDGSTLKIEFNNLDDQYSPPKSAENVKQLVESDKVFLVLNPLGTPPNTAIREYMNQQEVPQMLVATGASKWGKEIDQFPWTIGYQPDYESEGIAYAQYILEQNPDAKIGVLYQNDDFGLDYLTGLKEGLGDKANQIVAEVTYEVTDATVDTQVSQIKDAGADAYVVFAIPSFAIQAIQQKAALGWEPPIFVMTSVASSVAGVMEPAGFENAEGIVSSFYTKDPTDPALADDPGIVEYKEILTKYYSDANTGDAFYLYGMSVGQTFEFIIENMDGPLCRESIMNAVKHFNWAKPKLLEDGINVQTGPGDAFPIQRIQLKSFDGKNGTWVKAGEIIDTASAE